MPEVTTCDCRGDEGQGRECDACAIVSKHVLVQLWIYASTCAAIAFAAGVIAANFPL